jgi:hypothetical protein
MGLREPEEVRIVNTMTRFTSYAKKMDEKVVFKIVNA